MQSVEAFTETVELELTKTQIHVIPYKRYDDKFEFHLDSIATVPGNAANRLDLPGTQIYSQWYHLSGQEMVYWRGRIRSWEVFPNILFVHVLCCIPNLNIYCL